MRPELVEFAAPKSKHSCHSPGLHSSAPFLQGSCSSTSLGHPELVVPLCVVSFVGKCVQQDVIQNVLETESSHADPHTQTSAFKFSSSGTPLGYCNGLEVAMKMCINPRMSIPSDCN